MLVKSALHIQQSYSKLGIESSGKSISALLSHHHGVQARRQDLGSVGAVHPFRITATSRRNFSAAAHSNPQYTLYQYAICPYCNIAKTMLHYGKIPYEAVEVNPLSKAEIGHLDKEYRKVPIMTLQSEADEESVEQVNGSDIIVDHLLERFSGSHLAHVDSESPVAKEWTHFAREDLAPLLYPNLCNSLSNSYQAFGYVHGVSTFSPLQRIAIQSVGSVAMYFAASKIKKKRNIDDERAALIEALEKFHQYLVDAPKDDSEEVKPHLGELTIYGVLRGLDGLAVFDTVMGTYPDTIKPWYETMAEVVETK